MAWIWNNILGVITLIVTVYGAGLTTVKVWRLYKKKIFFITEFKEINHVKYLVVTVINKSAFPVTIEEIGLKETSGTNFKTVELGRKYNTPLPKKLNEGENAVFYAATLSFFALETRYGTDTQDGSHKYPVVPYARDSSKKEYKGKMLYVPECWVVALSF